MGLWAVLAARRAQQSNTDQQTAFRNRWSSSTSSRIASGRRARLHHLDLATHPGAGMLDRLTRPWVLRLSQLEQVKNVLRARCRPKSQKLVIRIGEGPTAADRHEARVSDLREDHGRNFYHLHPPARHCRAARTQPDTLPSEACEPGGRSTSDAATAGLAGCM